MRVRLLLAPIVVSLAACSAPPTPLEVKPFGGSIVSHPAPPMSGGMEIMADNDPVPYGGSTGVTVQYSPDYGGTDAQWVGSTVTLAIDDTPIATGTGGANDSTYFYVTAPRDLHLAVGAHRMDATATDGVHWLFASQDLNIGADSIVTITNTKDPVDGIIGANLGSPYTFMATVTDLQHNGIPNPRANCYWKWYGVKHVFQTVVGDAGGHISCQGITANPVDLVYVEFLGTDVYAPKAAYNDVMACGPGQHFTDVCAMWTGVNQCARYEAACQWTP